MKTKATAIRTHLKTALRDLKRNLTRVQNRWNISVTTYAQVGRVLPELDAVELRDAYRALYELESDAARARHELARLVHSIYGSRAHEFVASAWDLQTPELPN